MRVSLRPCGGSRRRRTSTVVSQSVSHYKLHLCATTVHAPNTHTQPNEMTGEKRIVKNKRERKTIYTRIKERTGERERDTI